jgi:hypothetical protein
MSSAPAFPPPLPLPPPPPQLLFPPPPPLPAPSLPYPFSLYPYTIQNHPISPLGWHLPSSESQTLIPQPPLQQTQHPSPPQQIQLPSIQKTNLPLPPPVTTPQPTNIPTPQPQHISKTQAKQNPITIENKSFKLSLVGGRAYPLCITERKFNKTLGTLWLRNKDMKWLSDSIDKAVQSHTHGDFFKHRRDGYKALHVIRRSNQHGNFLEVSEFHSGSRQSVIRIPEGVERQGWVDFSMLCKEFWTTTQASTGDAPYGGVHEKRKGVAGEQNFRWTSKGKEPKITPKFENRVHVGVKSAPRVKTKDTNGKFQSNTANHGVNTRVGLNIQLELVHGPDGK